MGLIVLALCQLSGSTVLAQGTWTQLTNTLPSGGGGTAILLSDGSVIVSGASISTVNNTPRKIPSAQWSKLTPDANGNYINGTWTSIASMSTTRRNFQSALLPNGNVFVLGGRQFTTSTIDYLPTAESYDPLANTWTSLSSFPTGKFGDSPMKLLNNGKILAGDPGDNLVGTETNGKTYLYDPASNGWSQTSDKLEKDQSAEESWALLPNGSVLSYDLWKSGATGAGTAQRYVPATGTWVATGPVPQGLTLTARPNALLGPMLQVPDGRVVLFGANEKSVIYSPTTDKWAAGPNLPSNIGCDDAPAVLLPNGHVLLVADSTAPNPSTRPASLYDYDPVGNTLSNVTPGGALGSIFSAGVAQQFCFLLLPNGHVLLTTSVGTVFDYTPTGSPSAAWAPTITGITQNSPGLFTLTGTKLNGLSEGSAFGDDCSNSTNYPIVRLKSATGQTILARTINWSPGLVASTQTTSTQFTVPTSLANGSYAVTVITNGIPSTGNVQLRINNATPNVNNVKATYTAATKTLVLTGDTGANSVTLSYQAGKIRVAGASGTTINSTSFFTTSHTGKLILTVDLKEGNDNLSIVGVDSSVASITLGTGDDKIALTLSNFDKSTIDFGAGTDVLVSTSTKFKTPLVKFNFP